MSSENTSRPLVSTEMHPGETALTTTTTETTHTTETEDVDRNFREAIPLLSSGDHPTNPVTEHRYGADIGTGISDSDSQNGVHTTYIIRESDFARTSPDSGEGIHARQYHGRELGTIPVGTTTVIRDSSGARHEISPEVHARIIQSEKHLGEGQRHIQRQILCERNYGTGESLEDGERELEEQRRLGAGTHAGSAGLTGAGAGAVGLGLAATTGAGGLSQHDRDLQREREMAIANERERITRERIDTHTGSIHGIFGHGRHRDAPIVGRDTDATDFGKDRAGKIDAHRDVLATSGSEHDRLIGTITGRERLAREQDAKFNSMLGSQSAAGDAGRYHTGTGVSGGTTTRLSECTAVPPASTRRVDPEAHGARERTRTTHDRSGRTDADALRHEGEQREIHRVKKPSVLDKIAGSTEAVIGKTTHNPAMTAKGEERAAGRSGT